MPRRYDPYCDDLGLLSARPYYCGGREAENAGDRRGESAGATYTTILHRSTMKENISLPDERFEKL